MPLGSPFCALLLNSYAPARSFSARQQQRRSDTGRALTPKTLDAGLSRVIAQGRHEIGENVLQCILTEDLAGSYQEVIRCGLRCPGASRDSGWRGTPTQGLYDLLSHEGFNTFPAVTKGALLFPHVDSHVFGWVHLPARVKLDK